MKIQFWSVGKSNEPYVQEGIQDFTQRIRNYFPVSWNIIPSPKNAAQLARDDLKSREAAKVLKMLQPGDCLVALDEKGSPFTSLQLATFIQSRANESTRQLIFLIGGAYGLTADILKRADYRWSLSSLTFPHQLVRLILAEQVYRACSILRNERYHHD